MQNGWKQYVATGSKGGEAYGQGKYGIVGYAWVLHAFDMDSLVGIVNSFLSNFGVCCV